MSNSQPDPTDLLQTIQGEPNSVRPEQSVPVPEHPHKPSPSPLAKRLQVLLRLHEAAGWFRVWQWIWWGIRALVVLLVTIPLSIGIGFAAKSHLAYDSPHMHARTGSDEKTGLREYYIRAEKVTKVEYDDYMASDAKVRHQADLVGWAAGVGTALGILLLWAIFEWLWKRRYAPLEEQIAGIQREFAVEMAGWGGAGVLRDVGAVEEILRQEGRA